MIKTKKGRGGALSFFCADSGGIFAMAFLCAACKTLPLDSVEYREEIGSCEERLNKYYSTINGAGYSPLFLQDASGIEFKRNGMDFFVILEEARPEFVQMGTIIWYLETEDEKEKALKAADFASGRTKLAKVFVSGEEAADVFVQVELYFASAEDFNNHFRRMLDMIDAAVNNFDSRM